MIARIREDKAFYGVVGGLLAALLFWNMFVRSGISQRTEAQSRVLAAQKTQLEQLSQKGAVTRDQIDPAHEAIKDVTQKLSNLSQRVKYAADPRFEPPKDQGALNHFLNLRIKSKELSETATKKGISWNGRIQQLNFNPVPSNDEEAQEHLIRLDLVYRVLESLYDIAGQTGMMIQRIEDVTPLIDAGQGTPTIDRDRFLNKIKVGVKFRCNGMTAFRTVHAVSSAEKMKNRGVLSIEEFSVERPDATVDLVDVSIVVSAVVVDLSKPIVGGAGE